MDVINDILKLHLPNTKQRRRLAKGGAVFISVLF